MSNQHFRLLYREFLLRVVELELLSPAGDPSKLLGQFAALLVFVNLLMSFGAFAATGTHAWMIEHTLIATTMLVVGLFAVLSWDSIFPNQRDVFVLGPLPVPIRTIFLAKVGASFAALALSIAAINPLTGIALPLALAQPSTNLVDMILSPRLYRAFVAYWITMALAGAFVFCCVLTVQGVAAQLLSRRHFLRLSSVLQMAAFCLFVSTYFLEPSIATPKGLATPENQTYLRSLPSYWFVGLFQQLNGSMQPVMQPLAARAWAGLGVVVLAAVVVYGLSYVRTMRKVVEEPDILPGTGGMHWLPRFGNSLETAVTQFAIRTVLRSRQHRVMLAFYLGAGFAIVVFLLKMGVASGERLLREPSVALMLSTIVVMSLTIVGMRVVFSIPLAVGANWSFRVTEVRGVNAYMKAIRRPLFVLTVIPVWLGSAVLLVWIWPWRAALQHLVILGLWGMILAYASLHGFRKIPFTCSYLPGKSFFHMAFIGAAAMMHLLGLGIREERKALNDPVQFAKLAGVLVIAAAVVRWRTVQAGKAEEATVDFDDVPDPAVLSLGLHRDGILPSQSSF